MTTSDKINLLIGVCGVEKANQAADYVRVWRGAFRSHFEPKDDLFEFMKAVTIEDLLINLLTKDLRGGALDQIMKEAKYWSMTLDFHLDAFKLDFTIGVDPYVKLAKNSKTESKMTVAPHTVRFAPPPPPYDIPVPRRLSQDYVATSDLIRRLYAANLVGWGTCLD